MSPKKRVAGMFGVRGARTTRLRPIKKGYTERLVLEVCVSGYGEVGRVVVGPRSSIQEVRTEIKARLPRRVPQRFAFLLDSQPLPQGLESSRAASDLAPKAIIVPRQGAHSQVMSTENQILLEKAREILIGMIKNAAVRIQKLHRGRLGRQLYRKRKEEVLQDIRRAQVINHRDLTRREQTMKKLGNSVPHVASKNSTSNFAKNPAQKPDSLGQAVTKLAFGATDSQLRFSFDDRGGEALKTHRGALTDGTVIAHTTIKMNFQRRLVRVRVEDQRLVADVFIRRTKQWIKRVLIDDSISAVNLDSERQKRICLALADRLQNCNPDANNLIHLVLPFEDESTLATSTSDTPSSDQDDQGTSSTTSTTEDQPQQSHDKVEKRSSIETQRAMQLMPSKVNCTHEDIPSARRKSTSIQSSRRATLESVIKRTRVLAQGVLLSGKKALAMIFKGDEDVFDVEVLLVELNSKMLKASVKSDDIIASAALAGDATNAEIAAALLPRLAIRKKKRKGGYELRVHTDVSKALASCTSSNDLFGSDSLQDLSQEEGLINLVPTATDEPPVGSITQGETSNRTPERISTEEFQVPQQAADEQTTVTKDTVGSNAPEMIHASFVTMRFHKFLCRAIESKSKTSIIFKVYGHKGKTRKLEMEEYRWQPTFGPLASLEPEQKTLLCQRLMKRLDVKDTSDVENSDLIFTGADDFDIDKRKKRNIVSAKAKGVKERAAPINQGLVYARGSVVSGERALCRISFDEVGDCNVEAVLSQNGKRYALRLEADILATIPIYAVLNLKQRGDAICDRLSFNKQGAKKRTLVFDSGHVCTQGETDALIKSTSKSSQDELDEALSEARTTIAEQFSAGLLKYIPSTTDDESKGRLDTIESGTVSHETTIDRDASASHENTLHKYTAPEESPKNGVVAALPKPDEVPPDPGSNRLHVVPDFTMEENLVAQKDEKEAKSNTAFLLHETTTDKQSTEETIIGVEEAPPRLSDISVQRVIPEEDATGNCFCTDTSEEESHQTSKFLPLADLKLDAIVSNELHPLSLSPEDNKRLANVLHDSLNPRDAAPVSEVLLESYFRSNFDGEHDASAGGSMQSYARLRPKKPRAITSVNVLATSDAILLLTFCSEHIGIRASSAEVKDTARGKIGCNDCSELLGIKISNINRMTPNQKLNLCWTLLMNLQLDESQSSLVLAGHTRLVPSRSIQMAFRIKTKDTKSTYLLTRISCERSGHLRIMVYDSSKNIVWTHLASSNENELSSSTAKALSAASQDPQPLPQEGGRASESEKERLLFDDNASLSSEVARYLVETCYAGGG